VGYGVDFVRLAWEVGPCGRYHVYTLAYGTVAFFRGVGGLKETVIDYDQPPLVATGFIYDAPTPEALLIKLQRSLLLYCQRPQEFKRLQQNAMACKFNWNESVRQYLDMYLGGEQSLVTKTCSGKVDA